MKTRDTKLVIIVIMLMTGFSCAREPEIAITSSEAIITRSLYEKNTDVDFYYKRSEKIYVNIRQDMVIAKASSVTEAEKLSKQSVFSSIRQAYNFDNWVLGSIDDETSMNVSTNKEIGPVLKSYGVIDAAYGLEVDGMMRYPTNQIFVLCKGGESPENVLARVELTDKIEKIELFNPYSRSYLITLNAKLNDILRISREMYETGMCEYAEPSFIREMELANEYYPNQWALNNTGQSGGTPGIDIIAEQAWAYTSGNPNIKVAVLDTGVDLTHPDLQANILGGYDCASVGAPGGANGGPWMSGPSSNAHGTQCAGIIGAIDNTIGVVGVASNCKIVPVRIGWIPIGSSSFATSDPGLASGIRYAWETAKVDVFNNSWGNGGLSTAAETAFDDAMTRGRNGKGCVVVFCSHNQGLNYVPYPQGSESRYLVVGNMTQTGTRASSSNYGTALDVVAPGSAIKTTTWNNGYNSPSGTSFAAPHVAGVAALILSINPNLMGRQVADIIEGTAQKVRRIEEVPGGYDYATTAGRPNGKWHEAMGYGVVDAYGAVSMAALTSSLTISGNPEPHALDNVQYSVPASLPAGTTFSSWNIIFDTDGSGGYTTPGGTNGRTLTVNFNKIGPYIITANFILPGGIPFQTKKEIDVLFPYSTPQIAFTYEPIPSENPDFPPSRWLATVVVMGHENDITYDWNIDYRGTIYGSSQSVDRISFEVSQGTTIVISCRARIGLTTSEESNRLIIPTTPLWIGQPQMLLKYHLPSTISVGDGLTKKQQELRITNNL